MTNSKSISSPMQLQSVPLSNLYLKEAAADLPQISPWMLRWFTAYSRRYLRRHFHALRIASKSWPGDTARLPLVIFSNHAAWWDPLVAIVLKSEFFSDRAAYAPMDAAMLARYKIFRRLGFFGVESDHRRGAVRFLKTAEKVLSSPENLLLITPQSRFADVRERPVKFESGLGHLAARVERAWFLPVAVEYVFWEERLPEILVRFGDLFEAGHGVATKQPAEWTHILENQLELTQDALAAEARARRSENFQVLLKGGAGQGGVYDVWRALRARLRGEHFRKEHGQK